MIPIYLVNLGRDADRLSFMTSQLDRLGLEFERFPAVLGSELPVELRRFFSSNGSSVDSPLKTGERGCYASHLSLMSRIADKSDREMMIVLEDDVVLSDAFPAVVRDIERLSCEWDIIRLSNAPKRAVRATGDAVGPCSLVKYSRIPNNTGAYALTARGARRFLNWTQFRRYPIDEDLRRPWNHGLVTFGVVPTPVRPNVLESTIDALGGRSADKRRPLQKLFSGQTEGPVGALRRIAHNVAFLGPGAWLSCAVENVLAHSRRRLGGAPQRGEHL